MKMDFRIFAKLALFLVIIGFCMPIACDMNGFQIAEFSMKNNDTFNAVMFYLLFFSAAAGVIIGVLLLLKKKLPIFCDWVIIILCVLSGLLVYFRLFNESGVKLQSGAVFIILGWIITILCQLIYAVQTNPIKKSYKTVKIFSVRTIVAIGIGAALMFVLMRFAAVPSGVPNTNLNFGIVVLSVFAAIFGPIAGFFIGFIGHLLNDLTAGWGVWWTWVIGSALFGFLVGVIFKFYNINKGGFGEMQAVTFNIVQILANFVVWIGIAPTLDILVYSEPSDKVFLQGLVAGSLNAAVVLILGTLLLFAYTKTLGKSGSLKAE